jgi:hypothetical protein
MIENPDIPQELTAENILRNGLSLFAWVLGVLAVAIIIYASIRIVTARGDVEKAKRGRHEVVWGLVGLAVALLSGLIVSVVLTIP